VRDLVLARAGIVVRAAIRRCAARFALFRSVEQDHTILAPLPSVLTVLLSAAHHILSGASMVVRAAGRACAETDFFAVVTHALTLQTPAPVALRRAGRDLVRVRRVVSATSFVVVITAGSARLGALKSRVRQVLALVAPLPLFLNFGGTAFAAHLCMECIEENWRAVTPNAWESAKAFA